MEGRNGGAEWRGGMEGRYVQGRNWTAMFNVEISNLNISRVVLMAIMPLYLNYLNSGFGPNLKQIYWVILLWLDQRPLELLKLHSTTRSEWELDNQWFETLHMLKPCICMPYMVIAVTHHTVLEFKPIWIYGHWTNINQLVFIRWVHWTCFQLYI